MLLIHNLRLLFILTCVIQVGWGQETRAFSQLRISGEIVSLGNQETFGEYWNAEGGVEGSITTPFYIGDIQAGMQVSSFTALNAAQPDILSVAPFLGWGIHIHLPYHVDWLLGLRIGINQLNFEGVEAFAHSESEVATGLRTSMSIPIYSNWALNVSLGQAILLTYKRIHFRQVSLGLSYSLSTPTWLRRFLE